MICIYLRFRVARQFPTICRAGGRARLRASSDRPDAQPRSAALQGACAEERPLSARKLRQAGAEFSGHSRDDIFAVVW